MRKTFELLTEQDWKNLLSHATVLSFKNNALIIEEKSELSMLYIILTGYVRILGGNENHKLTFDRLGPNEVFGEMSFLENAPASASVIAEENVTVQQIDATHLNSLIASDPGFSSRFYNSLAITLSERLRDIQANQKELNINDIAQVNRFHATRLGHITHRQIPPELRDAIHKFNSKILELDEYLNKGGTIESVETTVHTLCDNILELLEIYTQAESLVKIGFDDLLAFRDTEQLDIGIGAYIFRETFARFMLSETMAYCYMKPRGFTDDFKVNELIYANQPWGDGQLGPLIDKWFLGRNFCTSRREDRSFMTEIILDTCIQDKSNTSILSLASGSGYELISALNETSSQKLNITMIDIDQEALTHAQEILNRKMNNNHSFAFINQNIIGVLEGRVQFRISDQDLIYAIGFCDYLLDEQVVELLDWIFVHLKKGGKAVINVTSPTHQDRKLLTHILEWSIIYRSKEELEDLISRSIFAKSKELKTNTLGITTFAILEK
ncbi:cyclic nucleotide-binding domain-containing protein [Leptospira sp. GIMC2001]|uniref:cyclic nucleotide-binding domain-containing protein n=1 Tax=Leptospira sp. GIMC2001 TaxID=1513297 RepID=UPI00234AE563|nr:cyclic nucleotide-binding domain-containing protein [Leptospira sp. GIMC2001]WCL47775.1 cyclic nucleotide-binding domain-containing protein [Leptospira sp. GIMC2001]